MSLPPLARTRGRVRLGLISFTCTSGLGREEALAELAAAADTLAHRAAVAVLAAAVVREDPRA